MQPLTTRIALLIILISLTVAAAGCTSHTDEPADGKMAEIDAALGEGPVFVEFGAAWCHWCDVEKQVVGNLSANFDSVAFIDVDVDADGALADDFGVEGVPQMNIIVSKNQDGSYLYVDPYGKTTTDRFRSRIVGFREYDELKPLIEAAIAAR
jgi:thioredoxin 1